MTPIEGIILIGVLLLILQNLGLRIKVYREGATHIKYFPQSENRGAYFEIPPDADPNAFQSIFSGAAVELMKTQKEEKDNKINMSSGGDYI